MRLPLSPLSKLKSKMGSTVPNAVQRDCIRMVLDTLAMGKFKDGYVETVDSVSVGQEPRGNIKGRF